MEKVNAIFDWHLWVTCPHCGEGLDLSDNDHEYDYSFSRNIFSGKGDVLIGEQATCRLCGESFEIGSAEVW